MGPRTQFSVPHHVVHETLAGEVILINLHKGNYYSLRGAAAEIWSLLQAGHPPDSIARWLAECHPASAGVIEGHVEDLTSSLLEEGLLVDAEAGRPEPPPPDMTGPGDFEPPVMECYTEMQDFILFDPIHDVGPAGWPQPARD